MVDNCPSVWLCCSKVFLGGFIIFARPFEMSWRTDWPFIGTKRFDLIVTNDTILIMFKQQQRQQQQMMMVMAVWEFRLGFWSGVSFTRFWGHYTYICFWPTGRQLSLPSSRWIRPFVWHTQRFLPQMFVEIATCWTIDNGVAWWLRRPTVCHF